MRKNIVAGNWKMNITIPEGENLVSEILKESISNQTILIVAPPFTNLFTTSLLLKNSKIKLAAQNCADKDKGAFTGEVSASMIKSTGAEYVILGHSERRAYYNETDQIINAKIKLALKEGLKTIVCCGEVLSERESNKHFEVVSKQLKGMFDGITPTDFENIIIAYEPVWAIGTGKTATSDQAQEMHKYIRENIKSAYGNEIAESTAILYGGSCKPSNAKELFNNADVDGGLIGGASLVAKEFIEIAKSF